MKPFAICFAGVSGCGKSSVAHHLAVELGIARFERDQIRQEVKDDFWTKDINEPQALEEFNNRTKSRFLAMMERKQSFVLDSSIDRTWGEVKSLLEEHGYRWFVISFDMSDDRMKKLYDLYGDADLADIPRYSAQHQAFLAESAADAGLTISDDNFMHRLQIALQAIKEFIKV